MIKRLFFYMILAVAFTACNNGGGAEEPIADSTMAETLTVDNLLNELENLVGQEVSVVGHVDHVCKHGGTKMVIYTEDPKNGLHINATDKSGNFRADEVMDEMVLVTGIVSEFRVDEGYIVEKEAELAEKLAAGETVDAEALEEHDGKGAFPDNDNKHKLEIEGLTNQIADLKAQLEEARANGKEYISYFAVECDTYEILVREEAEYDEKEVEVETQGHVESAVENEAGN